MITHAAFAENRGKDVITHHIDGDSSNNDPTNLAVLCHDCHSRVTGTHGLGRKYSSIEVGKYKRDWEFIVRKKRHLIIEPYRKLEKSEVRSTRFEIKRNLYELADGEWQTSQRDTGATRHLLHL